MQTMLKYVEKLVDKITPVITKNFLKPMLVVLIAAPIALIVLGPLGAICGEWLSKIVYFAHDKLGFIAVGIVAGVFPFVVMAGMHHAFTPIKLGMIATGGYEAFICIAELCSNMAQGAAALAVAVKTKNKDFKQVAGSSAFSALVAGITEPALYGVTVRLKKPMLGACIGAVAGGLFGGFMQMKCYGIATPAIVTIVQYAEPGNAMSLVIAALTILITVVVTFIATMIIGFEDIVDEDDDDMPSPEPAKIVEPNSKFDKVVSPVEGTAVKSESLKNQEQSEFSKNFDMVMSPDKETVYAAHPGIGGILQLFRGMRVAHRAAVLRHSGGIMKAKKPGSQKVKILLLNGKGAHICHLGLHTVDGLGGQLRFIPDAPKGAGKG